MLDFDFFEILDSLTIARSRQHITNYYDTSSIGKFPKRNKPVSIESPLVDDGSIGYAYIADLLSLLNLSVYTPLNYVLPSRIEHYALLYDKTVKAGQGAKLRQIDREQSLQILMRINLLKRLESSVYSFRLTLNGIVSLVEDTLKSIEQGGTENPFD